MLSIVIPTLNEEKYLGDLLEDIHKQTFTEYEVIVADGNSKDRTQEIAKQYASKLVVCEKRSPAAQRNSGARIARGDLLLFLDADGRIYSKNFLEKSICEFHDKELGISSFRIRFDSPKLRYWISSCLYNFVGFVAGFFHPVTPGAAILIKKDLFEKVDGFNESLTLGEDHDLSNRVSDLARFALIKDEPIYTSVRRFEIQGFWSVWLSWLFATLEYLFYGKVSKNTSYFDNVSR